MSKRTKKLIRCGGIFLFILYMGMLVYFLFFAENMGRTFTEREYHYNLMPLKEIKRFWIYRETLGLWSVVLNLVGNVAAFIPFGIFLPRLYAKCRKFLLTMLFCFEFSLSVETIQLIWKVGSFDVDDILLNTLGGVLGFFCYVVSDRIQRRYKGKSGHGGNHEKKS